MTLFGLIIVGGFGQDIEHAFYFVSIHQVAPAFPTQVTDIAKRTYILEKKQAIQTRIK